MADITPELLDKIKKDFKSAYSENSKIANLIRKAKNKTITYAEANEYAQEIGEILSKALVRNLSSDILPNGRMYFNIANELFRDVLTNNYSMASDVAVVAQQTLNEAAGIGLKAIKPRVNDDKIMGFINRISSETDFDVIRWILGEPIVNFTQSAVDDTVRENVEFQGVSGLRPRVVRVADAKCCEWCSSLGGTYEYPDVPHEVFQRHDNCRCTVSYDGKKLKSYSNKKGVSNTFR